MRSGSEQSRKAEQIFVIPTCAWAVFVCCAAGRGHGNDWAGRTAGHGVTHSTTERVAACFGFTNDKWIYSEIDNFLLFSQRLISNSPRVVKGVALAYRRKQAGAG